MMKPARPRRIQLEGFKEESECGRTVGWFVEHIHELSDVCVRIQVWKAQLLGNILKIDSVIVSGRAVKNEENL